MNQTPVVSVVMAVYNTERYLAQAIESILMQTFPDFEFVIIDDGSTDRSLKILQKYAAQDDRIHLISRENRGIPKTRNELLATAQSDLIAIMDSDDVAMPDRLAQQVAFLHQHPEVVCVGGAYAWIDEAGRHLCHCQEPEQDAEIQANLLAGRICINNPSTMMRRSTALQVGGYDELLPQMEDFDLLFKLGELGKLANLPDTVLHYRQHDRSISEREQLDQVDLKRRVCEQAWQRRGIQGVFTETTPWRPVDAGSRHQYLLKYGWQFFNTGQRYAAIAYGIKSIRALPLAIAGWKLLISAMVKPLPRANHL